MHFEVDVHLDATNVQVIRDPTDFAAQQAAK
jgi:hypothetical protein